MAMICLGGAPTTGPSADAKEIVVEKSPVAIERHTFDPKHPPANMPLLGKQEAALTQIAFNCQTDIKYSLTTRWIGEGACRATARVERVTLQLSLKITIWLPSDVTDKLSAHEEGHRMIAERSYADAEAIARHAAEGFIGRTVEKTAKDSESSSEGIVDGIIQEIGRDYLDLESDPSQRIGDRYDVLTDHGRNGMTEKAAIEQAFRENR